MSNDQKKHRRPARHRGTGSAHSTRAPGGDREESKVYGLHACLALFERRSHDIVKLYLSERRKFDAAPIVKWCAAERLAYKMVEEDDLEKITGSKHHEGICIVARRAPGMSFESLLDILSADSSPACVLALEDVGNPHNVGAILRVAANFGVLALIDLSGEAREIPGAALRVAEGGGESVPLVRAGRPKETLTALKQAGMRIVATSPRAERSIFSKPLPKRCVLLMGSEAIGLSRATRKLADLEVSIPGTGAVESLNVSCATAVVLAEYFREHF